MEATFQFFQFSSATALLISIFRGTLLAQSRPSVLEGLKETMLPTMMPGSLASAAKSAQSPLLMFDDMGNQQEILGDSFTNWTV